MEVFQARKRLLGAVALQSMFSSREIAFALQSMLRSRETTPGHANYLPSVQTTPGDASHPSSIMGSIETDDIETDDIETTHGDASSPPSIMDNIETDHIETTHGDASCPTIVVDSMEVARDGVDIREIAARALSVIAEPTKSAEASAMPEPAESAETGATAPNITETSDNEDNARLILMRHRDVAQQLLYRAPRKIPPFE